MASENSGTPNGTGNFSVHGAAAAFDSLLAAEEAGTQEGEGANQGKPQGSPKPDDEAHEEGHQGEESDDAREAEEELDDDEAQQTHEEHEADDTHTVTIDGAKVTVHELKRGFLREKDYTQKTQALAEQRRQIDASGQQLAEAMRVEREKYVAGLGELQQMFQQLNPQEPDWQMLYNTDPARYAAEREAWRSYQEMQQGIAQQRAHAERQAQTEQAENLKRYLTTEREKLIAAFPEWSKPEVASLENQKLRAFGTSQGFTDDELNSIVDHRAVIVLDKARKYDELMAKKATTRPVAPKQQVQSAKPGSAGTQPNKATDLTRAKQRLAKTGRTRDAADAIFQLLGDD